MTEAADLLVIVRKEISDTLSNRGFLFALIILVLSMTFWGYASGYSNISYANYDPQYAATHITLIPRATITFSILGALVAIAYGFNTVNREREEGSLKVLLSYPVYRDSVIVGKLLASLIVITVAVAVSLMFGLAIYIALTRMVITIDIVLRLGLFTGFTVLFLSTWLGLSMLLSQALRDAKMGLMVALIALGVLNSSFFDFASLILTSLLYGPSWALVNGQVEYNQAWLATMNTIQKILPSNSYLYISSGLSSQMTFSFTGNERILVPSSIIDVLATNTISIGVLVVAFVIVYICNYIIFTRSDIS